MLSGGQFHEQLPLFVTAREVREGYRPGDAKIGEGEPMWDRKLAESKGGADWPKHIPRITAASPERWKGLHASISQEGVRTPVWAGVDPSGAKTLWEGHHRIASQYDADPDRLVPILYGVQRDQPTVHRLVNPGREEDQYPANPSGGEMNRFYHGMGFLERAQRE